ncbi:MAG TPA: lysophospholipid acyltransferase family protein [Candidatus Limnocylindria bacterium]
MTHRAARYPRSLVIDRRYRILWRTVRFFVRLLYRVSAKDAERVPDAPYCLVLNHHSGWDPLLVISVSPLAPRITWFGPKEPDLTRGFRNQVINFFGVAIPFDPATSSLTGAARSVRRVFDSGGVLGIFAEGQVGFRETELLPFKDGAVVFATASAVPIVPAAIVGSTYLWLGRRVEVRFGDPIPTTGVKGHTARAALEQQVHDACEALLPDHEPTLPRFRPLRVLGDVFTGGADLVRRRSEHGE